MKHLFTTLLLVFSLSFLAQERLAVDPSFRVYYKETSFETDDYKVYIEDAIAIEAWVKFKVRIFNKTNDYLIFDPTELVFTIGGKEIAGTDKPVIVFPNDEATRVVDAKNKGCQYDKINITVKHLHKVPTNIKEIKTEDFNIPPGPKEFTAGNFKCNLKSAAIKTDKTLLKFVCIYEGDAIGILAPGAITAEMPRGQENTNSNRNKGALLEKGKSDDFFVEFKEIKDAGNMQKDPFKLKWNTVFKESKKEAIGGGKFTLEVDNPKSAEKNK